ncbi:MAG: hypothetical protein Q9217_000818, partial [Psora testacea]
MALCPSTPRNASKSTEETIEPSLLREEVSVGQNGTFYSSKTEHKSHKQPPEWPANERLGSSSSASRKLLRCSRPQPSNLWNPINSSISTSLLPQDLELNPDQAHDTTRRVLALCNHGKAIKPSREILWKNHSHSRLYTNHLPPNSNPKRSEQGLSITFTHSIRPTAARRTRNMSPTPSLAATSDTPSKRPPTPAKDLEYGLPDRTSQHQQGPVSPSASSKRSSRPVNANEASSLPWNPLHPCYPHRNPHTPLSSRLYESTRIIRIPRDWMMAGDVAPTFSNTYPEILESWVSEQDFRVLIKGVNERLMTTFSPFGWRAWIDLILGLLTGWMWEDAGFAGVKKGCRDVESFIENWNGGRKMEKGDEEAEL